MEAKFLVHGSIVTTWCYLAGAGVLSVSDNRNGNFVHVVYANVEPLCDRAREIYAKLMEADVLYRLGLRHVDVMKAIDEKEDWENG